MRIKVERPNRRDGDSSIISTFVAAVAGRFVVVEKELVVSAGVASEV